MSQTYEIVYKCDVSAAVASINQLLTTLRLVHAELDKVTPKLAALTKGVPTPTNAAVKTVEKLGESLKGLNTHAVAATGGLQQVGTSATGIHAGLDNVKTTADGAGTGLNSMRAAGLGLGAVIGLASSLSEALQQSREYAHDAANEVLKLDDSVRELRMTMGQGTTTREASDATVALMLASGADQSKATAFNTMWESTVFAAKKKGNWKLNEKETMEAKKQSLAYAVASGMDEKTIGEVVPLIGVGEEITSPEQVLGKLGTMGKLAVEGVGNLTPMMKVYEKLRGTMVRPGGGGAFKSSEELLGAISSMSVTAGNVPAVTTAMNQVWTDLSFAENDKKKETFAKYGIKPGDDYQTRVGKIAPLVEGAKAKGQTELEALAEAGFTRSRTNPKIIQAVTERAILAENMEMARKAPDGAAVMRQNAEFRQQNPNRFAEATLQASKLKRGRETVDLEVMRKFAEADANNRGELNRAGMNFFENVIDMKVPGIIPTWLGGGASVSQNVLGQEPARQKILDTIVSGHIQAVVPDAQERFPDLSSQIDIPGINRLNPAFQPARSERLAEIVRSLTPEERAKVNARMDRFAQPDFDPSKEKGEAAGAELVPALRAGAPLAPGEGAPGGVGPQAALGGAGGGVEVLLPILEAQLTEARETNRKLTPGPMAGGYQGAAFGALGFDDQDFSGRRDGTS